MSNFKEFYDEVLKNKHEEAFLKSVQEKCGVSRVTVNNWKQGHYAPLPVYWPVINKTAVEFGYEKIYVL